MSSTLHGMKMGHVIGVRATIDQWPTMQTPIPLLTILGTYLLFVLKIGPYYMRNRKPYDLKNVLLVYNVVQVAFSVYLWLSNIDLVSIAVKAAITPTCEPPEHESYTYLANTGWWYMFAKFTELLDTVFFVLRKKTNQVTFLHVYHHSIMFGASWVYLKYAPGESSFVVVFLNSIVHTIMYGYYAIAALGPKYAKYIWWKKYMTAIQLVQFVLMLTYMVTQLASCRIHKAFSYFQFINTIFFLYLFLDFYRNSYSRRNKKSIQREDININVKEENQREIDSEYMENYFKKNGTKSMLNNIAAMNINLNGLNKDFKENTNPNGNITHIASNSRTHSIKKEVIMNGDADLLCRMKSL